MGGVGYNHCPGLTPKSTPPGAVAGPPNVARSPPQRLGVEAQLGPAFLRSTVALPPTLTAAASFEFTSTLVVGPPEIRTVGLPCTLNEFVRVGCSTMIGGAEGKAVNPHTDLVWTGLNAP